MGKAKRGSEYEGGVTGTRALSFWDPDMGGFHLSRRLRVRIAKRLKRRGGTLRDLIAVRRASTKVRELLDAFDEHDTAITDPEAILRGAR